MNRQDFAKPKEKVKKNAYITFIIDESSSMGSVREATITGINEQIDQIRKDFGTKQEEINAIVSLIKFSGTPQAVFLHKTLDDLKNITAEDYNPDGMTAMYDAVGFAINSLNGRKDINDENTSSLVIVVSDGAENASREFNGQSVAALVSKLNDTKRWTFTYLGANQDLSKVSQATNVMVGNTATFDSHSRGGVLRAFAMNASALQSYSKGLMDSDVSYSASNFYAGAGSTADSDTLDKNAIPPKDKSKNKELV